MGMLNPVIAGAAMALSSVSVVSNSLLLRRWQPQRRDS
jgi:Cu+-exporting ATPase